MRCADPVNGEDDCASQVRRWACPGHAQGAARDWDVFMTETAQRADLVLPAASAYEKDGTVTNVCGQVQKLTLALKTMGTKPDLEIIGLLAKEMKVDFPAVKPDESE